MGSRVASRWRARRFIEAKSTQRGPRTGRSCRHRFSATLKFGHCAFFGTELQRSFPRFLAEEIHHVIGNEDVGRPPRAAVRWSLDGAHSGYGKFGPTTGADVHVMGISHAEFGPWGLQREFTQYDEVAIWKQIEMQTGQFV